MSQPKGHKTETRYGHYVYMVNAIKVITATSYAHPFSLCMMAEYGMYMKFLVRLASIQSLANVKVRLHVELVLMYVYVWGCFYFLIVFSAANTCVYSLVAVYTVQYLYVFS